MQLETTSAIEMASAVAADVASRADSADGAGRMPVEDVQALTKSGYTTLSIPREYGGYGLPLVDCIAAHLELAQASASTAMVAGMQMQVFGHASETRSWPESIFEQMCRISVEHGGLFNSIASEPTLGSPSRGGMFQTYAEASGDGWVVNGHKNWATGGKHLTHLLVKLMLGDRPGMLLIQNNIPGISWVETWNNALTLRASDSDDVYFSGVQVPAGSMLEPALRQDEAPNPWFPMVVTAVYLGAALAARSAVIRYALERVPTALGKPIATLPKIQREIGEMDLGLQAARTFLLDACAAWTGKVETRRAEFVRLVAAKTFACDTAAEVTRSALHIAGGHSLTHNLPLERYFRDSQGGFSHPPSGDAAYEMLGKQAIDNYRNMQQASDAGQASPDQRPDQVPQ